MFNSYVKKPTGFLHFVVVKKPTGFSHSAVVNKPTGFLINIKKMCKIVDMCIRGLMSTKYK